MARKEKIEEIEIEGAHSIGSPHATIRIHSTYIEAIEFGEMEAINRDTNDRNDLVSFFEEIVTELKKIRPAR